ncbi:MAG: hypothetical protein ACP5JG_00165 [Anaerolineae bacterium]
MTDTPDRVIGSRLELFVNDGFIDRLDGAHLRLHHPERREVVFEADAAWEDNVAGFKSLVQDGGSVRLYYRAAIPDREDEDLQRIALAESTDGGLSFTRPNLGLVEFEGSRDNNLLAVQSAPRIPPAFLDTNPDCDPDARYKGLSSAWRKLYALGSPDGLRWHLLQDNPIEMSGTFDTINTAFWDALAGHYRCYTRYFEGLGEQDEEDLLGAEATPVRAIQSATSLDCVNWTPPKTNRYIDGRRDVQLYTNAVVPCPGAEHILLSFPNRYVQDRVPQPDHPYPGVNDALFMASRDGVTWTRYLDAWVRPGLDPLNWTDRNNYPTWGLVQTSATEWSLYISEHYRHATARPRLRRLSVRPHGFVSLHADYRGGECVTEPLSFATPRREAGPFALHLNASTSAAGSIRVEIQDEEGAPLPGYTLADADPWYGDSLDAMMTWRGKRDLGALVDRPIRLRFRLADADVFALQVR